MISFVFYFHSARADNLKQTLRFLFARESAEKEVLLVCNDRTEERFPGCRLINMGIGEYRKAFMCNLGVKEARGDVVALMDSDRILPRGYFSDELPVIKRGEFVSCERMLRILGPRTDEQINTWDFEYEEEFRSKGWDLWRRNIFSGNTMFHRSDYFDSGGMDESFVGYGFADNDMARKIISMGFKVRWKEASELHLYHPKESMKDGKMVGVDERTRNAHKNMCRFLKKWRMKDYLRHCGCIN